MQKLTPLMSQHGRPYHTAMTHRCAGTGSATNLSFDCSEACLPTALHAAANWRDFGTSRWQFGNRTYTNFRLVKRGHHVRIWPISDIRPRTSCTGQGHNSFSPPSDKHGRALVAGPVWLHHPEMEIRDAQPEDAHSACEVVRRSISELCAADQGNDPAILSQWLKNKTPGNVGSWIARPDNSVLVAVEHGTILAVGAVTDSGELTLN